MEESIESLERVYDTVQAHCRQTEFLRQQGFSAAEAEELAHLMTVEEMGRPLTAEQKKRKNQLLEKLRELQLS